MVKALVFLLCAVPLWSARNVILMVADGWGEAHILAADYYLYGQAGKAPYESLAYSMYMSTSPAGFSPYDPLAASADATYVLLRPTDSAASGTALACGVKTYNGRLGIDTAGLAVLNMAELAQKKGKAAGVVSTVPFTHATPAAMVYHGWDRLDYAHIAEAMLSSTLEVMMGEQGDSFYAGGPLWDSLQAGTCQGPEGLWTWSSTASSLDSLGKGLGRVPERLVGVYEQPRLSELALAALRVLDSRGLGFFLLLEGGKVDWAGHVNSGDFLLESMKDFNEACSAVIEWIGEHGGWEHNLLVVT